MGEVIITFNDGESTVETKGIKGKSCKKASEFIEKGLGDKKSDKKTKEFYEKESNTNKIRRRR
jgi:hypothetical protein